MQPISHPWDRDDTSQHRNRAISLSSSHQHTRTSDTFQSSIFYNQHLASLQKVFPNSKKKFQISQHKNSTSSKKTIQHLDHPNQDFYPCTYNYNYNQERLRGNSLVNFVPQYPDQSIQDRRRRDFVNDSISFHHQNNRQPLVVIQQSPQHIKQANTDKITVQLQVAKENKQESPKKNVGEKSVQNLALPTNSSFEQQKEELNRKFQETCSQKSVEPISIKISLATPSNVMKRQRSSEFISSKKSTLARDRSCQFNRSKNNHESNEGKVQTVELEISGLENSFDEKQFQRKCRQNGLHMVYCHPEYNKLTNKQSGKGQLLLRNPKQLDAKEQLRGLGYTIKEKQSNNKLTYLVPNLYILKQQEIQKLQDSMSKQPAFQKSGHRIEQKYERYANMSKQL